MPYILSADLSVDFIFILHKLSFDDGMICALNAKNRKLYSFFMTSSGSSGSRLQQ